MEVSSKGSAHKLDSAAQAAVIKGPNMRLVIYTEPIAQAYLITRRLYASRPEKKSPVILNRIPCASHPSSIFPPRMRADCGLLRDLTPC